MSNIGALPSLQGPCTVEDNEDWLDAVAFFYDMAQTQPVALDGIGFTMLVRLTPNDPNIYFTATTANGFLSILSGGALVTLANGGVGHAVGDVLTMGGGVFSTPATVKVLGINSGVITAAALVSPGSYAILPSNPISQTQSTGAGTLAAFNFNWINNAIAITVPKANFPLTLVPGTYAFEIVANADGYTRDVVSGPLTVTHGIVH